MSESSETTLEAGESSPQHPNAAENEFPPWSCRACAPGFNSARYGLPRLPRGWASPLRLRHELPPKLALPVLFKEGPQNLFSGKSTKDQDLHPSSATSYRLQTPRASQAQ